MAKEKFEDQMKRLEEIVEKLEAGETDMDESISLYEEGLELSRKLKKQLQNFEKKIEEINKDHEDE
ncbi:MAG: exodeoxyribonuclease VII small subunit [Erysipelotrichaceae bacterium]|nr:exodeoxyribonuclease VII small subunit [Erysipelotrichaceae bacterium]